MKDLNALEKYSESLSSSDKMPVLFIGHGNPMNAIEENEFSLGFKQVAQTFQLPKAIICISAHWFTKGTCITAMEMPATLHDFYGFPQELYQQQYPAHGNPELASKTQELLKPTQVTSDYEWGLDHGTWSILKHMYPNANVPVIQLSIDSTREPEHHYRLAKQMQTLRSKGILIIGSGNIVHNLGLVDWPNFNRDNYGFDWAIEARETVNKCIKEGEHKPLLNYEKLGKAMQLAVPTPDHYLPLIYTLGLQQNNEQVELFNDKLQAGSLSMTSVKIS